MIGRVGEALRLDGKAAAGAEGLAQEFAGVELQGREVGVERQRDAAVGGLAGARSLEHEGVVVAAPDRAGDGEVKVPLRGQHAPGGDQRPVHLQHAARRDAHPHAEHAALTAEIEVHVRGRRKDGVGVGLALKIDMQLRARHGIADLRRDFAGEAVVAVGGDEREHDALALDAALPDATVPGIRAAVQRVSALVFLQLHRFPVQREGPAADAVGKAADDSAEIGVVRQIVLRFLCESHEFACLLPHIHRKSFRNYPVNRHRQESNQNL